MKKIALFVFIFNFFSSFCQEKDSIQSGNSESVTEKSADDEAEEEFTYHTVQKGETIALIYKKYLVDPKAIYKLNKEAVDGVSEGMVLKIPVSKYVKNENQKGGIEKVYVSEIKEESKKGGIEKVYVSEEKNTAVAVNDGIEISSSSETELTQKLFHKVEKKETLFSIAKKNNISLDELLALNPEIKNNTIVLGQQLKLSKIAVEEPQIEVKETATSTEISTENRAEDSTILIEKITHIVQPKETLYSLSKLYNVTVDSIKNLNPILKSRALQLGQELIIKN